MDDIDLLLGAYVDGELHGEELARASKLMATDPRAARHVVALREMRDLLQAACAEEVYASSRARTGSRRTGLAAAILPFVVTKLPTWALAASLAFGILGFGAGAILTNRVSEADTQLIDELAEYHAVYSRETEHLVEVSANQSAELATWLGGRLERRLPIPDLAGVGLRFAGGRMLVIDGRPAAQLMYTRARGLPVGICILFRDSKPAPLRIDRRGELRLASWDDATYTYVVVGEIDTATARNLADRVAEQVKG